MVRLVLIGWLLLLAGDATAEDRQVIRFGVETGFPPFAMTLPTGQMGGFDVEIIKALCTEPRTPCAIKVLPWEGMIPALLEGKIDAIPSLAVNEGRREIVDFSNKYYETTAAFIGPKSEEIELSPEALAGKTVGVQSATIAACYLERALADTVHIRYYDNQENANFDLSSGRIDLGFADTLVMTDGFLTRSDGADFEIKGEPVFDPECMGVIAFGLRKGEEDLQAWLNDRIAAIRARGVFQEISNRYFGYDIYGY